MKAKCIKTYQTITKGSEGTFTEDDSWQGAYVGRRKPYGYFEFTNNSGSTKLSIKLVKESDNFDIITNGDNDGDRKT